MLNEAGVRGTAWSGRDQEAGSSLQLQALWDPDPGQLLCLFLHLCSCVAVMFSVIQCLHQPSP